MSVAEVAADPQLVRLPSSTLTLGEPAFKIGHGLSEHPLFEPERIKQLLRAMPRDHVEIREVQQRENHDGNYRRGRRLTEADPVETFERLAEHPSWMLLHQSWKYDRDYECLLHDYLAELTESSPDMQDGVSRVGCWMFLSSGKSVVHFHSDPDQSFLNQIRGSKTVFVYPADVLPESAIDELVYTDDQKAVTYSPEYEPHMFAPLHIGPGEAAFLPLFSPHRVTNDDGVSVSWNVGFHTRKSLVRRDAHFVNYELRRWGVKPRPVGERPWADRLKGMAQWGVRAKNKVVRTVNGQKNCCEPSM